MKYLALLLVSYIPSFGAVTFVNSTGAWSGSGVATLAAAGISHTTGNSLWVGICAQNGGTAATITDTAGNTYTPVGAPVANLTDSPANYCSSYGSVSITGNVSNVVTAAISGNSGGTYTSLFVFQFSGILSLGTVQASGTGTATTVTTSTSLVTAGAIMAIYEMDGRTDFPGSGFTQIQDNTFGGSAFEAAEYQVINSTLPATATAGAVAPWIMVASTLSTVGTGSSFVGPGGLYF